jgi:hypothetical protein
VFALPLAVLVGMVLKRSNQGYEEEE